jgi:ubiquitin C-terminal hydrolase
MIKDSYEVLEKAEDKMQNNVAINQPGVSGLANIGNTCYMNASLQNLLSTNLLAAYLIGVNGKGAYKRDLKNGCHLEIMKENKCNLDDISEQQLRKKFKNSLTYNLRNLFLIMWSENCAIQPEAFKNTLDKKTDMFRGHGQQDAEEFLRFVLDEVYKETHSDAKININDVSDECLQHLQLYQDYMGIVDDKIKILADKKISKDEKRKYYAEYVNYMDHCKKNSDNDIIARYILYLSTYLKKYGHSALIDIFYNISYNNIKCKECENNTVTFDIDPILQLGIKNDNENFINLGQCLDNHFSTHLLLNDEKYECLYCDKKCDAKKKTYLWTPPQRLIIQLKRFEKYYDKHRNNIVINKINSTIDFPIEGLNMEKYLSQHVSENAIYDLYGVIFHTGNYHFGHYVGFTKNSTNDKWYLYDDSKALEVTENTLKQRFNNSGPYILLYKKRGDDSPIKSLN